MVGFVISAGPFLAAAPVTFIRSTIIDQAAREGSAVAFGVRLANLTGLIDIYTTKGQLTLNPGANSMFAAGASAGVGDSHSIGWAADRRGPGARAGRSWPATPGSPGG